MTPHLTPRDREWLAEIDAAFREPAVLPATTCDVAKPETTDGLYRRIARLQRDNEALETAVSVLTATIDRLRGEPNEVTDGCGLAQETLPNRIARAITRGCVAAALGFVVVRCAVWMGGWR